jgi:hypothetical protein
MGLILMDQIYYLPSNREWTKLPASNNGDIFNGRYRLVNYQISDSYWIRVTADYEATSISKKIASTELKKAK